MSDRFEIIPTHGDPPLWVIWDKQQKQVIDVMDEDEAKAYFPDGEL